MSHRSQDRSHPKTIHNYLQMTPINMEQAGTWQHSITIRAERLNELEAYSLSVLALWLDLLYSMEKAVRVL